MNKGKLVVISGPSGIGKGTVCKELIQKDKSVVLSVSWTTRERRKGEEEGVTYFYRTEEQFDEMIAKGGFLEYAGIYGGRYGTPRDYVAQRMREGKNVVLEIETKGAMKVMEAEKDVISIYLLPPTMKVLRDRLINRGREGYEKAMQRFRCAYDEIDLARDYQYYIVNEQLNATVRSIMNSLRGEYRNPDDLDGRIRRLKEEVSNDH